jgi:hypothetical protein
MLKAVGSLGSTAVSSSRVTQPIAAHLQQPRARVPNRGTIMRAESHERLVKRIEGQLRVRAGGV